MYNPGNFSYTIAFTIPIYRKAKSFTFPNCLNKAIPRFYRARNSLFPIPRYSMQHPSVLTLLRVAGKIGRKDTDREEYAVYPFRERNRCPAALRGCAGYELLR